MSNIARSNVSSSSTLLKRLARKVDANKDGKLTHVEVSKAALRMQANGQDPLRMVEGLKSALTLASSQGGATLERVGKAIDRLKKETLAADKDGDAFVSTNEQKALKTLGQKRFLRYVEASAGKRLRDYKI